MKSATTTMNHTSSARKRRGKRDNYLRNKINKAKGKKRMNAKSKAMKQARRQLKAIAQQNKDKGGEKIVASLWPDEAILVESSSSVSDCARLMTASRADSALITCNGSLCGIITDNDICRRVINQDFDPKTTPVALAMTGKPMTVTPNHFAIDALSTMVDKHFRHLPVAEGTTIYGQLMISKCIGEAVLSLKKKIDKRSKKDEVMSVASSALDEDFISELGQMTLGDLIKSSGEMPPTVMESAKVREAVRIMADRKVTAVLTTKKDGEVCGILTTKDVLLRVVAAREDSSKTSCSRVHTPYPDMVPHTMSVLDALTHMSEKHYLHLPVSGGDSTLADGTSGLVDALQLITHMLRPPLPELGEDTKNQGKDPDVLRKLLRMSGVGVDIGDMSYSEDTESRAGGNYDDDDRSSVFSRTLQEDSISVSVRNGLRREYTFKLCDMTGRWHRFTIPVSYQVLLREIGRVAPDAVNVSELVSEALKENDATAGTATPVTNRVLSSIQENNNMSNTPGTPSIVSGKSRTSSFVSDGKTFELKSHVQIMYEDEENMWTVISSESNLTEAVDLARDLRWKNVRIYLKKSDGTPPKQRPLEEKKEKVEMPPPMPRSNTVESRHLQEALKSTERRLESLQAWREKSGLETRQNMMEMESSIRRQIEGIQTRAEKLADDTNAAALKQQQQWSLMHELTMKKIGKLAEECSSLDTKVAESVAPFDRKVQSLAEKGKILAEGVDAMTQQFVSVSELARSAETKIENANVQASNANDRASEAIAKVEKVILEIENIRKEMSIRNEEEIGEKEKSSSLEMFERKLSSVQASFVQELKTLKNQIEAEKSDKTNITSKIGNAFTKISDTAEDFRMKHMRMLEMVATLKAQTTNLESKMSEIRCQMMNKDSSNIDTTAAVDAMSSKFEEMESMFAKKIEEMGKNSKMLEKKNEELRMKFETEQKQVVEKSMESLKLPTDQLAIGAAAVSIVSIALAMTVSFLTRRK